MLRELKRTKITELLRRHAVSLSVTFGNKNDIGLLHSNHRHDLRIGSVGFKFVVHLSLLLYKKPIIRSFDSGTNIQNSFEVSFIPSVQFPVEVASNIDLIVEIVHVKVKTDHELILWKEACRRLKLKTCNV